MLRVIHAAALACLLPLAAGCATKRPVLYPNAHYAAVGAPVAASDIALCQERAAEQGQDGLLRGRRVPAVRR